MVDNPAVSSKTELFKTQANEQVKQHVVRDGLSRIVLLFTAYIDTPNNGPCSVTEYIYDGTSTDMIGRQERAGKWNSTWDAAFTYDPTVSYDTDGDGVL